MDDLKLKEIIDKVSTEILNRDIVCKDGVVVNGNSKDKNDFVIFMSHEGYKDFKKEVLKELKNEKNC